MGQCCQRPSPAEPVSADLSRGIKWQSTVRVCLLPRARENRVELARRSNGEQGRDEAHPGCYGRRRRRWRARAGAVEAGGSIFAPSDVGDAGMATPPSIFSRSVLGLLLAPGCSPPSLFEHEGSPHFPLSTGLTHSFHLLLYLPLLLFLLPSAFLSFSLLCSGKGASLAPMNEWGGGCEARGALKAGGALL